MSEVAKALDAFMQSDNSVLVIKGDWGVGKTFFWNKYYNENKSNLKQIVYSYVSLFGKNSLSDIKREIFHLAKPIKKDKIESSFQQQTEEISGIYECIPWLNPKEKIVHKIPFLKPIVKYADNTPLLFRATNLISNLEYSLINNYLVCFDDLERRGSGLSIKEVMGFIDELAQRKKCKVVLIFNEETLHNEDDKEIFNIYREKIVDIELKFSPTIKENFDHVFFTNTQNYDYILGIIEKLQINNIRFFKKLKQVLLSYETLLKHADSDVREEFILRACILCWGYYTPLSNLPYNELRLRLEKGALFAIYPDEDYQESEIDKAFQGLQEKFVLYSSSFDAEIDFFLNNGYINDSHELHKIINTKNSDSAARRLNQKISNVWRIYHQSFDNNDELFINGLEDLLNNELLSIPINRFDDIVRILRDFDISCDNYVEEYFANIEQQINFSERDIEYSLGDLYCNDIKERLKRNIEDFKNGKRSITNIAIRLSESNGWNPEDINYLNTFSTQDFAEWMRARGNGAVDDVRHGLLKFRNSRSNEPVYDELTTKVIDALKIISTESKINHLRVRNILRIELESQ